MLSIHDLDRIRGEAAEASRGLGAPAPSPYPPFTWEDRAWMDGLYDFANAGTSADTQDAEDSAGARDPRPPGWGPGTEDEQLSLF